MKRILIVDDHEVVREGVKKILEEYGVTAAFGDASTPCEAISLACEQHWDMVILDLSLGETSGLDILKHLRNSRPNLPVLVLSTHSDAHYARRCFTAGAAGYIAMAQSRAEWFRAISRVLAGHRYVSEDLLDAFLDNLERGATDALPHSALSDREYEVFRLIASGKTVGEIARLLSISEKTVSTYRTRLLEKLRMKSNAELTHYALVHKLLE
jgi:two-component system, NarL family, invasion response regulator UvrY